MSAIARSQSGAEPETSGEIVCSCGVASPATARFCANCGRPLAPQAESEEERRWVTAVFADLSGFTSLAGQVDAEGLVVIVDDVITGLSRIVERYEGRVAKFVGDAVLALFGAPIAHEDDAARALRAAQEMHDWLAARPSRAGIPTLALHIGVNTGEVVARSLEGGGHSQYDVLGESVIIAQRLEALAPNGQTYVGELTRRLAAASFGFEDLGLHPVKGRTEPIPVFRLLGRRASSVGVGTAMFGRDRELAALVDALRTAHDTGAVVRVVGAAGSGKSRLVAELRAHPAAGGALFCEIIGELYSQSPYRSLAPLFTAALQGRYPDCPTTAAQLAAVDADRTAPAGVDLTSVLLGEPVRPDFFAGRGAHQVARELHATAAAWLQDLSTRQDVVVVVENLQWLEPSSADLLDDLASDADVPGVLFCFVGRPSQPAGHTGAQLIELHPLDAADIGRLIDDELGLDPDERMTAFVTRRSDGNPLMARETVRNLWDEGLLDALHGHVRLVAGAEAKSVPATLRTLLAARLDSMPANLLQVATTAAAIGITVPATLLAVLCDDDDDDVDARIGKLVDAGVLNRRDESNLRFDSPIVRDVLYSRLTRRRRQVLHTRIADTIPGLVPQRERATALLAEHRFLAGDPAAALPWLRAIADQARRVYAHDDAVVALSRAIESARAVQPPQVELLSSLLCDLGDVRMELGEYALAGQSYRDAQDTGRDARAFAGYGASLRRRGRYAEARSALTEALDDSPTGDLRHIWGELSAARSVSGDLAGSLAAARTGLALGGADDRVAALLLLQIVRAETLLGDTDTAQTNITNAIAVFERIRDDAALCTALRLLGSVQESSGRLDEAAATLQRGFELADRLGLVEEIGGCLVNLGLVKGAQGDHRAAADCYARAAVTFERSDNRAGRATAYANRAYELFMLGDVATARELGTDALALAGEVGNHLTAADVQHTLGLIAEVEGERRGAREHARAAIEEFELAGMPEAARGSHELAERNTDD